VRIGRLVDYLVYAYVQSVMSCRRLLRVEFTLTYSESRLPWNHKFELRVFD